jgi:hypothetical protein
MPGGLDGFEICRIRTDRHAVTPVVISRVSMGSRSACSASGGRRRFPLANRPRGLWRGSLARRIKQHTDSGLRRRSSTPDDGIEEGYSEGHCHRMANTPLASAGRSGWTGRRAVPCIAGRSSTTSAADRGRLDSAEAWAAAARRAKHQGPTVVGDRLCSNLRSLQSVRPIVHHHEH